MPATLLTASSFSISFTVNDLKRSRHFYTEGLGFEVEEEWKTEGEVRGIMLKAGEAQVALSQDNFAKGRNRVKGVGMRLHVETAQDLNVLARQAKDAGITLDGDPAPMPWGPLGFSVTDPDGFQLTLANPG